MVSVVVQKLTFCFILFGFRLTQLKRLFVALRSRGVHQGVRDFYMIHLISFHAVWLKRVRTGCLHLSRGAVLLGYSGDQVVI